MMKALFILVLYLYSVSSYAGISWNRVILSNGPFLLMGFVPDELQQTDTLNIFIEGDGKPGIALDLAKQIGGNSVYIARPCQYFRPSSNRSCSKEVWTSHRFSEGVIDSINHAIAVLKVRYKADKIRLIGFSGGGAIATIIASKRGDVALLVTVAGNLDHKQWTDLNHSEPLYGSLNPVDFVSRLDVVPQIHLVGDRDDVVPTTVLASYLARLKSLDKVHIQIVNGADHTCCWTLAVADALVH
jgi:pimeloyl-ACP methyl ester carboxylesterase